LRRLRNTKVELGPEVQKSHLCLVFYPYPRGGACKGTSKTEGGDE
jgi:hypothetical protein